MLRPVVTFGFAAMASLALSHADATAQDRYPAKPITIIVDRAPGGGTDLTARIMAQSLTKSLGQQVIVENHAGAAGRIGVQRGRSAAPDGYTLMVLGSSYTVMPALFELDFNAVEDVTPIVMLSQGGLLLVASNKLGVKTLPELLERAKKEPGKITSATVGSGSISDLSTALMSSMAGTQLTSVQYKGIGPALIDTIAGVTDIAFSSPANAIPQVKAGQIVAIATTASFPMPGLPDVPSASKVGLPDFDVVEWYGVIGPKNLPAAVVDRINAAVNEMLKDREVIEKINRDGFVPAGGSAADFKSKIAAGVTRWKDVAKKMNIKPQ